MKWLVYILALMSFVACTSAPKPAEVSPPQTKEIFQSTQPTIDYVGLQRSLGMEIPLQNLGYKEKVFETCSAGYGYSSTHSCRRQYLVVINIHLQCRDSVGTVSEGVTNADLTPIAHKTVRWTLKGAQGSSQTDADGYGQIMTVSNSSQKQQRLKLAVGNEFLYMRANEITRVVTPRPWCDQ